MRSKRIKPFLRLIESVYREFGLVNIIDVGGNQSYWNIVPPEFLVDNKVTITIVNFSEKQLGENYGPFKYALGDGCSLTNYDDREFHIAHSNSVVEHVGNWRNMIKFRNEIKRVATSYYVQTPNYWFPVEPHCITPFFHWLPKPFRVWLVMNFALGNWRKAKTMTGAMHTVESNSLLTKKMFVELFDDAELRSETFFFIPKSYVAIRK